MITIRTKCKLPFILGLGEERLEVIFAGKHYVVTGLDQGLSVDPTRDFVTGSMEIWIEQETDQEQLPMDMAPFAYDAMGVVNRILQVYRFATRQPWVEGFSSASDFEVMLPSGGIYREDFCIPFTLFPPPIDVEEVKRIVKSMLLSGESIPLHEHLLLEAKTHLLKRNERSAIIDSFTAVEVFVDSTLRQAYSDNGLTSEQVEAKLSSGRNWQINKRLKELMREVIGRSPVDNQALWGRWLKVQTVRNEVVHTGATPKVATEAVRSCEQLINSVQSDYETWLKTRGGKKIR